MRCVSIEEYAEALCLDVKSLCGRSRRRPLSDARCVYAVYLRDVVVKDDDGLWSYSRIGRLFGRSHSTMFLNCKRQRCFLQAGDRMTVLLWNVLVHAAGRDDLHRQAKLC